MAFVHHWKHQTITGDSSGRALLQSANPTGTHAFAGGGWLGGSSSSTDTTGAEAAGGATILAQVAEYDSVTDTTYWNVIFSLAPGASARGHVYATVES